MKAWVTVGISASGKSTWANQYVQDNPGTRLVCRDNIRAEMQGLPKVHWASWRWKDEKLVDDQHIKQIKECAALGLDLVVADTNLTKARRDKLVNTLTGLGYAVLLKDFPVTLKEAWRRDSQRESGVGHDVIYRQWQQWLEYCEYTKYVPDSTKPRTVLVDIDGTLAHMSGRSPYNWELVHTDTCDEIVREIVNSMYNSGTQIIVVSGRDGKCRDITQKWLDDNGVKHHALLMRAADDVRTDSVVKEEIFWRDIAHSYNVVAVIDDRPQVVRTWLDLGIKVLCVGNPWLEF